MADINRQHGRIARTLTILFCVADHSPQEWDMSVIKNISVGGVMFLAPGDLKLKDKTVLLKIGIPELAPQLMILEALVVDFKPCFNAKISEVRAKFINLTDTNKEHLLVVQKIVENQKYKEA